MRAICSAFATVLALLSVQAPACSDELVHERSFPGANQTSAWPTTSLEWGDVNFIHTTDTHGWLLGHAKGPYPEPNYSGDFGDFKSFVLHMKEKALHDNVDLLLVDSGDIHEGTGLTDGGPPGSVNGVENNKLFEQLPYDVLTIGNHELYQYDVAYDTHKNFAPKWGERYLTSNVNIIYSVDNTTRPIGSMYLISSGNSVYTDSELNTGRYTKFTTLQGRKVTAFGVLYSFKSSFKNITIQSPQEMVKQSWFISAIKEEPAPDFFLLVGHMTVTKGDKANAWLDVFHAIRDYHPLTPIFIFGGHTHIRDCVQLDERSMSLQSGRYMETVGWMSAKLPPKEKITNTTSLEITRRYLDANRNTYQYHTKPEGFDTPGGLALSKGIVDLGKKFNITFQFGSAPNDWYITSQPYNSSSSVLSLFSKEVLPVGLRIANPTRKDVPFIAIVNSLSQRFDVFKGPFTRNDQFTVSGYDDAFLFVTVPFGVGKQILDALNGKGTQRASLDNGMGEEYPGSYVDGTFKAWLSNMWVAARRPSRKQSEDLTLGYVTNDSCPGKGDDTPHTPVVQLKDKDFPHFISSPTPPGLNDSEKIDVIFFDHYESQFLDAINKLQKEKPYTKADVGAYGKVRSNEIYGVFAEEKWNKH